MDIARLCGAVLDVWIDGDFLSQFILKISV